MKKANTIISVIITLIIFYPTDLLSQDWTQFRGDARDSRVTGFRAPAKWPSSLTREWKVKVGTGDATPVLAGDKIYLNTRQEDDEVILCLDANSGKMIWFDKYAVKAASGPASSHPGPRSTPVIGDKKIITFGISGILSCLDASTGKVIWRKDNPSGAVPEFYTGMSPLVAEGLCIVQTGSKGNGCVVAFDLRSGDEKWRYNGEGPSYSSASVMTTDKTKQLIFFSEKSLASLDLSDGKLLWQIPAPTQKYYYNCVSPYIDGNKIYYSGQGTGTKSIEVTKKDGQFIPVELWNNPDVGAKWNTPVLKDGFLYGFTDQRRIYCLNASNGQTAWIDPTANGDFATLVDCGKVLIGFPSTGYLLVFNPDPKGYREIARYQVTETQVYAFPVISGNVIYIKDADSLIKYRIE